MKGGQQSCGGRWPQGPRQVGVAGHGHRQGQAGPAGTRVQCTDVASSEAAPRTGPAEGRVGDTGAPGPPHPGAVARLFVCGRPQLLCSARRGLFLGSDWRRSRPQVLGLCLAVSPPPLCPEWASLLLGFVQKEQCAPPCHPDTSYAVRWASGSRAQRPSGGAATGPLLVAGENGSSRMWPLSWPPGDAPESGPWPWG